MSVSSSKKEALRAQAMQQHSAMPLETILASNRAILQQVQELPEYRLAGTVLLYVGQTVDVSTIPLVQDALLRHKTVAIPHLSRTGELQAAVVRQLSDLCPDATRFYKPRWYCTPIAPIAIDFAFVPALCCDRQGNRLDHGYGYYNCSIASWPYFPVAAPCREPMLAQELEAAGRDTPVDIVITARQGRHAVCGFQLEAKNKNRVCSWISPLSAVHDIRRVSQTSTSV